MNVITIRSQIREVYKRWKDQYAGDYWATDKEKMEILAKLRQLPKDTATADQVKAIIGNESWACEQECDECEKRYPMVIEFGERRECTVRICLSCLKSAVRAAVNGEAEHG
ncbi:MAG TPA: hypothetical protein VGW33_14485 [Terriglobia bacterium]|nr:hypothetical protein [Terriglobia bacterium]